MSKRVVGAILLWMLAFRTGTTMAVLAIGVVLAVTAPAADEGGGKPAVPECIRWHKETRYRNYGYDHVVIIQSACEKRAVCVVKTNVNPDSIRVQVLPGDSKEVLTYMGSPARVFEADVQCELKA